VQFKDHDDLPKSDQRRIPQSGKEDIIAHQHRLLARDPEAQAVSPPGEFSTGTSGDYSVGTHTQALMLLMETAAMRARNDETGANATEKEASDIANRALDMAVKRNTTDNTIRYVRTCVLFGIFWLAAGFIIWGL
jgi:hypothetical protein